MLTRALLIALFSGITIAQPAVPTGPLVMRDFRLQFDAAGTFALSGAGWPSMTGAWTLSGNELSIVNKTGPNNCSGTARYTLTVSGDQVGLDVVADDCQSRRMILDRSRWLPWPRSIRHRRRPEPPRHVESRHR